MRHMGALPGNNRHFFIHSTFKRYLIPSIMSVLGSTVAVLFDSVIVGNYIGADGLAALGMVKPIYYLFMMLGVLINVGAATHATVYIGKGKRDKADNMLMHALVLSVITGIAVSVLGLCFLEPVIRFIGGEGSLYSMVYDYGAVMLLGGTAVILMYFPFNFLRVDGRPRYGVIMFACMAALNLVLDILFVPVLRWGMMGIASACVLSTLTADVLGLCFTFSKAGTLRLKKFRMSLSETAKILSAGSAMALNNGCNVLRTLLLNQLILAEFGSMAVTVLSLTVSIGTLSLAVLSGVAQTVTPLIGVFFGEKDTAGIRETVRTALKTGLLLMGSFALLVSVFSVQVCALFGVLEPEAVKMAVPAVWLYSASLLPAMVNNIYISHFFTIGRTLLANVLTFLRAFGFVALFAGIAAHAGSLLKVWAAFPAGDVATFGVMLMTTALIRRKNPALTGNLLLNTVYEHCGRYISFSVPGNPNAAAEAAEKLGAFCEENALDRRTSMMLSLSIEEMLVCICEHCFDKGAQPIDVRIFLMDDIVILRIRNNGSIFDPVSYYEKKAEQAGGKILTDDSLGIGMIVRKADSVSFSRTFGVNNLTIWLHLHTTPKRGSKIKSEIAT